MRLVFGISGASGMPLAKALLQSFATLPDLEIHLLVSSPAKMTIKAELGEDWHNLANYAHAVYEEHDFCALPASGSWITAGMIVCPCSMSTLAAIANGCGSKLMHRAADVTLKERRPLLLAVRETPFNLVHLRNMTAAAEAGATIMPFIPVFYGNDSSLQGAMRNFAGRMLDLLHIPNSLTMRWQGLESERN